MLLTRRSKLFGLVIVAAAALGLGISLTPTPVPNERGRLKAHWEESRLSERYPDYAAYSALVPRFMPRPRQAMRYLHGDRDRNRP